VYRFLSSDCRAYLPSYDVITVWHLRDLAEGRRKIIKCTDVKVIQLPYYEGLTIDDILKWAKRHNNGSAMKALPEVDKEILKLPRAYLANVIHTLVGDPFQAWADDRINERNEKVMNDKDMAIELDPSVAAIFRASNAVSGEYKIHILERGDNKYVFFYSDEGNFRPSNEGVRKEKKVPIVNQRRQGERGMGKGRDSQEDPEALRPRARAC